MACLPSGSRPPAARPMGRAPREAQRTRLAAACGATAWSPSWPPSMCRVSPDGWRGISSANRHDTFAFHGGHVTGVHFLNAPIP